MSDDSSVTPVAGDLAFTREDLRGTVPEAAYAGALSFMRRRFTRDLRNADVAILGIPYDLALSGRSGTRFGPRGVRAASSNIAWSGPWPWDSDPYESLAIVDYGDCEFDPGRPEAVPVRIEETARQILATDTTLISIGGDHFVTYPLLKAHAEKHGPLHLIQFDAHTDTWADEDGRIDHGTMFWHATREGLVLPEQSVQVGIRTHNPDTIGFNVITSREVHKHGPEEIARRIREIVGDGPCYVTFDIDALDPSAAPGTGTPVIGGLTTYEAQEMLFNLAGINVVGMDLVEVSPPFDHAEITALAGATLVSDLLAVYAASPAAANRFAARGD
ncbi:agmatinase [Tropicimonas marinistellae]|uniref:agmatinase n=1 Tax=Tropicimonas marinistellae TaxID=1739787 RepID=UPI0008324FC2|nr:agmatinase [Tropicimonas marinistellae]